jgi:hypothetical protein
MKMTHQKLLGLACAALTFVQLAAHAAADYQSTVLSQGPVGYWRLNETVQPFPGIVATNIGSLGSSENGAYISFPTRGLPGPFAGSVGLGMDGVGSYVSNAYQGAINTTNAFTFEIWANPAQVPKFAYLASSVDLSANRSGWYMAQDDGSTFGLGNGFVVRFFYQNGANPAVTLFMTNDLPLGSWYHIVLTYNGTTATFYKNGAVVDSKTPLGYIGNANVASAPFTIGCRSSLNFFWPGKVAEVAEYNTALSAARVSAHYTTANTTPANYQATVLADAPLVYQRYQEPIDPPAANLGTAGAAANGLLIYDTQAGVAGPSSPPYVGFEAANKAVGFDAGAGVVRIPALNLNTNTMTISGWVKATTDLETAGAGLVVCDAGATYAGLTIDAVNGGLGLGYVWNNDPNTYNVSLTTDLGLPTLPSSADNQWAYVALVVQPSQAAVFISQSNNPASFAGVTNLFSHVVQPFAGPTLFGADVGSRGTFAFAGGIDEVAIFNRALGVGELYTQYGAAVGGVAPKIFTDLQGPTNSVAAGDPITLFIDAGGTPALTFTWHRNGSTIATTSSGVFTIATSALTDAGNYDVTISNGSGSVGSQQVHVTVVNPTVPAITGSSGFVNRRLYTGGTINLSLSVTGGGLKYQWYKNTAPISGATASAFTIASVATGDAGSYSVSVTNSLGVASNGPAVITVPTVPAGGFEAAVIASAPESWWRLDEATGSTNLWDGMGRHDGYYTNVNGTVPPVTLGAAGIGTNTAASFSNNGGVGVIPFSAKLNGQQHTYEGWIKTSVLTQFMVPYSSAFAGNGVFWAEVPNGFWTPDSSGGYYPINPLVPIAPSVWTHLAMTYDSTIILGGTPYPLSFYINGVNISGAGIVWTDPSGINTGGPIIIGGRGVSTNTLADSFFSGLVDDVAVYARSLSATEISNHFILGFPKTPPTFAGAFVPQTVTTGKSVSFSTTVQGTTPIQLQWYKNSTLIAGATTNSIAFTNTAVSDTATYTLWATNTVGTNSQSVSLTVIPATGYANVTNNLVLHLRFDGNTTDTSGRGNNGTAAGGPSFVTGIIGSQALQYTTTSATNNVTNIVETGASYVKLGTPSDLLFGASSSFSVGLWVQVASNNTEGDLPYIGTATNSNNNPGWDLSPSYGSGSYQWNLNDGTNNLNVNGPANAVNDGRWHHFVLSVDRTGHTARTYLDGVLVAQNDTTGLGSLDVGGAITVGQDPTGTYPFAITNASATDFAAWVPAATTTLDDVGVWRRALSPLEVAQIESAGRTAGHSFDTVSPVVTLTISKSGSTVTISWPSGTLYQSDSIGAGAVWTPVGGASAPSYTFTPSGSSKYYRVQ